MSIGRLTRHGTILLTVQLMTCSMHAS